MERTIKYKVEVDTTAAQAAVAGAFAGNSSTSSSAPQNIPRGTGVGGSGITSGAIPNFSYISGIPGAVGFGSASLAEASPIPKGGGTGGSGIVSGLLSTVASGLGGSLGVAGMAAAGGALGVAVSEIAGALIQTIPSLMLQAQARAQGISMASINTAMGGNPLAAYAAQNQSILTGIPILNWFAQYSNAEFNNTAQYSAGLDTLQQNLGQYNPTIAGLNFQKQYFQAGYGVMQGQQLSGPLSERQRWQQMATLTSGTPEVVKDTRANILATARNLGMYRHPGLLSPLVDIFGDPTEENSELRQLIDAGEAGTLSDKEWEKFTNKVRFEAKKQGKDPSEIEHQGQEAFLQVWRDFASKDTGKGFEGRGYQGGPRGARDVTPTMRGVSGLSTIEQAAQAGRVIPRPSAGTINMHWGENMKIQAADEERLSMELMQFTDEVRSSMANIHNARWWRTFMSRQLATSRI